MSFFTSLDKQPEPIHIISYFRALILAPDAVPNKLKTFTTSISVTEFVSDNIKVVSSAC